MSQRTRVLDEYEARANDNGLGADEEVALRRQMNPPPGLGVKSSPKVANWMDTSLMRNAPPMSNSDIQSLVSDVDEQIYENENNTRVDPNLIKLNKGFGSPIDGPPTKANIADPSIPSMRVEGQGNNGRLPMQAHETLYVNNEMMDAMDRNGGTLPRDVKFNDPYMQGFKDGKRTRRSRGCCLFAILVIVVIVFGAGIGIVFGVVLNDGSARGIGAHNQSPTQSPISSTNSPSTSPTVSPTPFPTKAPTLSPTRFPTQAPTQSPTTQLQLIQSVCQKSSGLTRTSMCISDIEWVKCEQDGTIVMAGRGPSATVFRSCDSGDVCPCGAYSRLAISDPCILATNLLHANMTCAADIIR